MFKNVRTYGSNSFNFFLFRRRPGTSLTAVTLWFCVCCIPEGLIAAAIARPRTVTLFMFNIIKYFIPLDKRQPAIADGDVNIANMDASIAITVSRTIEEPAYPIKEIAFEIYPWNNAWKIKQSTVGKYSSFFFFFDYLKHLYFWIWNICYFIWNVCIYYYYCNIAKNRGNTFDKKSSYF